MPTRPAGHSDSLTAIVRTPLWGTGVVVRSARAWPVNGPPAAAGGHWRQWSAVASRSWVTTLSRAVSVARRVAVVRPPPGCGQTAQRNEGSDQRAEHGPGRRRGSPVAADSGARRHPPGRDLCPGAESEPDADALNVPFGGALVDAQSLSDFPVRQALGDECRHLALPPGQGGRRRPVARRHAEEAPGCCDKRVDVSDVWKVRPAGKDLQPGAGDACGDEPRLLERGGTVVFPVHDQRGGRDLAQGVCDVDVVAELEQVRGGSGGRRLALVGR